MSNRVRSLRALAPLALAALLAPPASAGEVWIVEEPPLGPFATIQQAIDAAPEGALLTVELDTYDESPLVDGKSLTLVGLPGPTYAPVVRESFRVRNLGPDQRVVLRRLDVLLWATNPTLSRVGPAVLLEDNAGAVRLEDCHLAGGRTSTFWPWAGEAALEARASTQVVLRGCRLDGGRVGYCAGCEASPGGDALRSVQSAVALFECELEGGMGSNETVPGGPAGHGARVEGFGIVSSGSALRGGEGGGADYVACDPGGPGGDGLHIVGAQAKLVDTTLVGGPGGWGPCNNDGPPGAPIEATASAVEQLAGPSRSISSAAFAQDGERAQVQVSGVPGDRVALFVSDEPAFEYAPELSGLWALAPPALERARAFGTIPASGSLALELKLPFLAAGEPQRLRFLQAVCRSAGGQAFLSAPTHVAAHASPLP